MFAKNKKVPLSHLPSFFIEFSDDGTISVRAGWPKPKNNEDLAAIVKGYVGGLSVLENGSLLPLFQHSISIAGHHNSDDETAKIILMQYNNFKAITPQEKINDDRPIIEPSEVFHK